MPRIFPPASTRFTILLLALGWLFALSPASFSQKVGGAKWIWTEAGNRPEGELCFARLRFQVPFEPEHAALLITCDNEYRVWLNGRRLGRGNNWQELDRFELGALVKKGQNVLAIRGRNGGGPAAILAALELRGAGKTLRFESGSKFRVALKAQGNWRGLEYDDASWAQAAELAGFETGTWRGVRRVAEPVFDVPPGFKLEQIAKGFGSLIALTQGQVPGSFIISVERGGLFELSPAGEDGVHPAPRKLEFPINSAQGLCYHRGSLWAMGAGPEGLGLYRLNEGKAPELHGKFQGGGEHGPHAVVEGPDGELWVTIGNHSRLLDQETAADSPFQISYEGHVLRRFVDPRGHATKIMAPGGLVLRYEVEKKRWSNVAAGLRNAYDIAFHRDGSLFVFDSDMEWDVGLPWYRPVRLYHVVPGAEYGWRTGSSKWPSLYADMLPPVLEVGRGSPTGLLSYSGSNFPSKYRDCLLAGDWSQGRILAFFLERDGMGYRGRSEVLLRGRPLGVTDLALDRDGSLVFTVGGRGTRGGVYRLSYEGLRDRPERMVYQGGAGPLENPLVGQPVKVLVGSLSSKDRSERFLAQRALQKLPLKTWWKEAISSRSMGSRAEAFILRAQLHLHEKTRPSANELSQCAGLLRVQDLDVHGVVIRALGLMLLAGGEEAKTSLRELAGGRLLSAYPSGREPLDREYARLIAALAPVGAASALLSQLEQCTTRLERVHLADCVGVLAPVMTAKEKERLAAFHQEARRWSGGFSYVGFLAKMREEFSKSLSSKDVARLLPENSTEMKPLLVSGGGHSRDSAKLIAELYETLASPRRSAAEGALVFERSCARCHQYGKLGEGLGPDLSTLASRFGLEDLVTSLLEPSREVSDQYRTIAVGTKKRGIMVGMPLVDDATGILLLDSEGVQTKIPRDEVTGTRASKESVMPKGLMETLSGEEIADLFHLLLAGKQAAPLKTSAWQSLMSEETLSGWKRAGAEATLNDGALIVRGQEESAAIWLPSVHGDFCIECDILLESGQGGLLLRGGQKDGGLGAAYRVDFGGKDWGSLSEFGGRGMMRKSVESDWVPAVDTLAWNHVFIVAEGPKLIVEIAGTVTATLEDDVRLSGVLGFELSRGGALHIRNLRLRR